MKKILCLILICIFLGSILFTCSDPFSEEKDALVRILVDESLEQAKYTVYWDGKNENEQYVRSGIYYARLYGPNFDDQLSMLVEEGGTAEANFHGEPIIEYGVSGFFELVSIEPDTFKVKEGTTITFIIDDHAAGKTVRLVIRNKK